MNPFRIPTRVVVEPGCRRLLAERVRELGAERPLLVVDAGLLATPWVDELERALGAAGTPAERFAEVEPNPRAATVERLAERARGAGSDALVALGGGSVLDAAKAAAVLAVDGGSVAEHRGRRFAGEALPLIALPTTCGTGSEVTRSAVISVPEERSKISLKGEGYFPRHALVDAELLATLPPHLVAWTGLDALTHALEAVAGRLGNPLSDALATRAVELLLAHLERAVAGDAASRAAAMTASTLAGMAFGNADVGAVHCLSETLGGGWDAPHGLANAMLLAPVLRAHGGAAEPALARVARRVLSTLGWVEASAFLDDHEAADRLLAAVEALVAALGLPAFETLGVPAEDDPWIAAQAVANGSNASNPRPMGEAEYLEILATVRKG